VHASADGLDFSRSTAFGYVGEAFVAEWGDLAPLAGKVLHPVGYKVVRVNVQTGVIEPFAENRGDQEGPASKLGLQGLERPVAVRFDPHGDALYVVDFGIVGVDSAGVKPQEHTGVIWRITKD
jgi:glucose/arabinose dehydrogenase